MLNRDFTAKLEQWYKTSDRKPLVVRGARQVGKTTTIKNFGVQKKLIYLNLEKMSDKNLFSEVRSAKELIKIIEVAKQETINIGETILFIDEIQESENALNQLRFFYEETPGLHVVAAGSLLEVEMEHRSFQIPVGRVEYAYMSPLTFTEYLKSIKETKSVEYLDSIKLSDTIPEPLHNKLSTLYKEFTLLGGMPEIVANHIKGKSYEELTTIYESILIGYSDDISKYAKYPTTVDAIKFIIETAPKYSGTTITYNNFDNSHYQSKQISSGFKILERARLFKLVRPSDSIQLPIVQNLKAKPKLIFFDTGLANYVAGLSVEYTSKLSLDNIYKGQIAEQAAGLSLWNQTLSNRNSLNYWTKFKAGSTAEIDFLYSQKGRTVPIEVKSGPSGRLRSLHQYIDATGKHLAIKITSNQLAIEETKTIKQNKFRLVNIPHFLTYRISEFIENL